MLALAAAVLLHAAAAQAPAAGVANVRDFGAKGDGVADDHAAIVAAIGSAAHAVYFPPGTYRSGRTIELKKPVRLFGDGSGMAASPSAAIAFPAGVPGIVVHRANTLGAGKEGRSTGQADGAIVEGLRILGGGGAAADGIWLRARALLRNVLVSGFSGSCVKVLATSRGAPAEEGNANLFRIEGGRVERCGRHGLHVDGGDANAGYVLGLDASDNGGFGIFDSSFLGNTYVACHAAGNRGGAYLSDGQNARNVFLGCYSEGNQPPSRVVSPAIVVGGLHGAGFTPDSTARQLENARSLEARAAAGGVTYGAALNGNPANGDVLYLTKSDVSPSTGWRLRWTNGASGDLRLDFANLDAARTLSIRGPNTRLTAGRSAPLPYAVNAPRLLVGDGGDATTRLLTAAAAPPATGEWAQGDVILNVKATPGGHVGWVCTKGGQAGVDAEFKPFGAIER